MSTRSLDVPQFAERQGPMEKMKLVLIGNGMAGVRTVSYTHLTLPTTPYV